MKRRELVERIIEIERSIEKLECEHYETILSEVYPYIGITQWIEECNLCGKIVKVFPCKSDYYKEKEKRMLEELKEIRSHIAPKKGGKV